MILNDMGLLKRVGKEFESISRYEDIIEKGFQLFERAQVDGIIYVALHDRDVSKLIKPVNIPFVLAYCYDTSKKNYYVTYDNKNISKKAVQYLIDHNHTDIGLICGGESSKPAHQRFEGYKEALEENQLSVNNDFIFPGDWEFEAGRSAYERYKKLMRKPTAIFAMNDLMAVGFMDAALDDGVKIPEEVSVIGFDNQQLCQFTRPRLTTVDLPLEAMGDEAGRLLLSLIRKDKIKEKKVVLNCQFIEKKSVSKR